MEYSILTLKARDFFFKINEIYGEKYFFINNTAIYTNIGRCKIYLLSIYFFCSICSNGFTYYNIYCLNNI